MPKLSFFTWMKLLAFNVGKKSTLTNKIRNFNWQRKEFLSLRRVGQIADTALFLDISSVSWTFWVINGAIR